MGQGNACYRQSGGGIPNVKFHLECAEVWGRHCITPRYTEFQKNSKSLSKIKGNSANSFVWVR